MLERKTGGDDIQSSRMKEFYNIAIGDVKRLLDLMSDMWNQQNPSFENLWERSSKGSCTLCLDLPTSLYCGECEKKEVTEIIYYLHHRISCRTRKISILSLHGLKLLQKSSFSVKEQIYSSLKERKKKNEKKLDLEPKIALLLHLRRRRDKLRDSLPAGYPYFFLIIKVL